jgi:3-deoxy-manno-octulosonate cytidylyltransferase (CMP-KDO synthetase)
VKRVIVIPARYASTRLPGKPLLDVAGKPLIEWVWEAARASKLADGVLIATDDERIAKRCVAFGAEVAMTGECASGTDRVCKAVGGREADFVINLQGDEPEIRGDMIDALFSALEDGGTDMATLCSVIDDPEEYASPDVVKCVLDEKGFALYFSRSPVPYGQQGKTATLYKHIGIYGFTRPFLETFVRLPKGRLEEAESLEQLRALEAGYRIRVIVTEYDGTGVDTQADLDTAAARLGRRA